MYDKLYHPIAQKLYTLLRIRGFFDILMRLRHMPVNQINMKTILLLTKTETSSFKAVRDSLLPLTKERGWAIHVFSVGTLEKASRLVKVWNPDGCIVYCAMPGGLNGNFGVWRKPTVTINAPRPVRGATSVVHDSCSTGLLAARELLSLGLDNFAFFAAGACKPWVETRFKHFSSEIERRGLQVRRYHGGSVGAWLESLTKPCGLFAANDIAAERIVSEAIAVGISVPNDISLVSCDDDPQICEHMEVTISSVRPDFPKCAALAVNAMSRAMETKRNGGELVYGDIGVTRRASTRPIAGCPVQVSAMLEYIRLNALSGISSSDVLKRFPVSRRTAETRFRKTVGHSIVDEIQSVRLAGVKRLLADPLVKIGSIASRVGYDSENFLTRLFKRETGQTPSQWRHSMCKPSKPLELVGTSPAEPLQQRQSRCHS